LRGNMNVYCTLHACSVDAIQLMQLITVGCFMLRDVGNTTG
jgi:hypothetical protein